MTMNFTDWVGYTHKIVARTARDNGAAAALRRGLGRDETRQHASYGIIIPLLPETASSIDRQVAFTIANLIAASKGNPGQQGRSLGAAIRDIDGKHRNTSLKGEPSTLERRLLSLGRERDLGRVLTVHLPGLVARLRNGKTHPAYPDWASLAANLANWRHGREDIAAAWLRDYHTLTPTSPDITEPVTTPAA